VVKVVGVTSSEVSLTVYDRRVTFRMNCIRVAFEKLATKSITNVSGVHRQGGEGGSQTRDTKFLMRSKFLYTLFVYSYWLALNAIQWPMSVEIGFTVFLPLVISPSAN